jgi:hypothetical protein
MRVTLAEKGLFSCTPGKARSIRRLVDPQELARLVRPTAGRTSARGATSPSHPSRSFDQVETASDLGFAAARRLPWHKQNCACNSSFICM